MKKLLTAVHGVRGLTAVQRRIAFAALIGLLLLVPSLPHLVVLLAAAVAVWAGTQPLLVGMALGAYARRRKAGAR